MRQFFVLMLLPLALGAQRSRRALSGAPTPLEGLATSTEALWGHHPPITDPDFGNWTQLPCDPPKVGAELLQYVHVCSVPIEYPNEIKFNHFAVQATPEDGNDEPLNWLIESSELSSIVDVQAMNDTSIVATATQFDPTIQRDLIRISVYPTDAFRNFTAYVLSRLADAPNP